MTYFILKVYYYDTRQNYVDACLYWTTINKSKPFRREHVNGICFDWVKCQISFENVCLFSVILSFKYYTTFNLY